MRRKVLQDFANTLCQNYVDLTGGFDAAAFACYGSGTALMNFLSGNCTFNDLPIPVLKGCTVLKDWLHQRFAVHAIVVQEIALAQMTVSVVVSQLNFRRISNHAFYSGHFNFNCLCEIRTDDKMYCGQMIGEKVWGFGNEYDELCSDSVLINQPP